MYFDDLKVTHTHSPIVAGADFYPFGLAMDGREIKDEHYRWGYQGQYAEKDTITGLNEFQLRMYDARFGRWLSADPYGQYHSPYMAMGNVPQMSVDPDGGWNWTAAGVGFAAGAGIGYAITGDWEGALLGGLAGGAIGGASFRTDTKSVSAGNQTGRHRIFQETVVPTKFGYASGNLLASAGKGYLNFESQKQTKSRFFTNESDAYQYMWKSSFDADGNVQQEVAGFLTPKGVLVLPTEGKRTNGEYAKNGPRKSYNDFLPLSRNNNNIFVTFNNSKYQVLGQVHTHPNAQSFGKFEVASDIVTENFLGVPIFMIRTNGFYNTSGTVLGTQQQFFNGTKSLIGGK